MARRRTDEELLTMLRLRDEGMTCAQIGQRVGMSKSAVAGALWRLDVEDAAAHDEAEPARAA